jgi:hypothetical protein
MDLSEEFEHFTLDSFLSDTTSEQPSIIGLTIDSRVTNALCNRDDDIARVPSDSSVQNVTVESFLEECCDAGISVFPESDFEKQDFIGTGATMDVYKAGWKTKGQIVALK